MMINGNRVDFKIWKLRVIAEGIGGITAYLLTLLVIVFVASLYFGIFA